MWPLLILVVCADNGPIQFLINLGKRTGQTTFMIQLTLLFSSLYSGLDSGGE